MVDLAASGGLDGPGRAWLIVIGVFAIGMGLISALKPELAFRMSMWGKRWEFRNRDLQPSEMRLVLSQVGGWISILVGIGLILIGALV
jgi:hypothetical protein